MNLDNTLYLLLRHRKNLCPNFLRIFLLRWAAHCTSYKKSSFEWPPSGCPGRRCCPGVRGTSPYWRAWRHSSLWCHNMAVYDILKEVFFSFLCNPHTTILNQFTLYFKISKKDVIHLFCFHQDVELLRNIKSILVLDILSVE